MIIHQRFDVLDPIGAFIILPAEDRAAMLSVSVFQITSTSGRHFFWRAYPLLCATYLLV